MSPGCAVQWCLQHASLAVVGSAACLECLGMFGKCSLPGNVCGQCNTGSYYACCTCIGLPQIRRGGLNKCADTGFRREKKQGG